MEFRILGPLEVLDDGSRVDLRAAKPRALLAVLLLNANRVVSNDQLIESLWGERPPSSAQKALHVHVSHLRKLVGRERILTRPPGYELRVEPGELDLERFETLATEGNLAEALALWRGSALADFAYEPFAQAEISRLDELRLAALERRIANDLEEGRHEDVVGELETLVRDHPLRERVRAQLMLALYRSGRQAEALDVYTAGRALLSEELGLEPGQDLKDLQRAILEQDPGLDTVRRSELRDAEEPPPAALEPTTTREVRKTVTVLYCDLTPSGVALDLESLGRMTARGFEQLLPVLERHGATVGRSLGGAVTAIFGVPTVHEDDAMRAARAAVEMRDRLAGLREELEGTWGAWLELRAGIATGQVVAGGDGSQPYVTGAAVQSAIRLQQAARPDDVLVDGRTHRLVRDAVDTVTSGEHTGIEGVRPARGFVSRFDSPLVGRERERRRLDDAFEQAVGDRSCQLFTILGAPGVGKSRLVSDFVADVGPEALVAQGRCLPYGEGITYWPVREAVRDAASLDDAKSADENLGLLACLLEDEPDAALTARRLGEVIGLVEQTSGVKETFQAVRILVGALARRRPLVLVFDDIHWGEATFLDLVDYVADWTRDVPVLLVCMARPELLEARPHWGGGKLNATSVLLEPLSESESVELLDNLEGSAELDDPARQHIVEAAGGNPLFVEEMLALVLEEGRSDVAFEVPPTIQALLGARLDLLPAGERSAIEAAAVEGKVFHEAMVIELVGGEPAEVQAHLQTLMRKELIRPDRPLFSGERAYRFRHLLIRDAAYESIAKAGRADLHERYAGWLEQRAGERAIELEEILGYHLEQAYLYRAELGPIDDETRALGRRAAERLGLAGRRALMRSDASAGVNLISRSTALLPPDDPFRVELVPNFRVIQGLADLSWADRVLTEAVEAAATSGNRALAAHALVQRGFLRLFTGAETTSAELVDVANRAIAVFEALGDELGLARAWRLVAQAHYLDRRAASCVEASEQALAHARRAGDRFEQREVTEWLVIALLLGSTPAPVGLARFEQLLELEWDDLPLEAEIAGAAATLLGMQGRLAEAEELIKRSRATMGEDPERIWLVTLWAAFIRAWQGDPAATERELRPAYEALGRVGETTHFSTVAHSLANALYLLGRYDEAERLTEECERVSRANDVHSQTLWRSVRAKILAQRAAFEDAERLAHEAVDYAAAGDFLPAHADALADLAEVYELAGKPTEAAHALEEAIVLYEQKGNAVAAAGCRERAASLTSAV